MKPINDDFPGELPPAPDGSRTLLTPQGKLVANRPAYVPPAPRQSTLLSVDHAEWLTQFCACMSMDTGVPMTDFRKGAVTRLSWAAQYIKFLEKRNESLQAQLNARDERIKELKRRDQEGR